MAVTGKKIFAKVYDYTGAFITTLDPINPTSDLVETINKGYGSFSFSFPAELGNYGEGYAVWYNNEVQVIVVDPQSPDGTVIYTGVIVDYTENSYDGKDRVNVNLEAYTFQLYNTLLRSGDNVLFKTRASGAALDETLDNAEARSTQDVKKKLIDLYRAENPNPKINYSSTSVASSGYNITYTWVGERVGNALDEVNEWEPAGWFTRISPTGIYYSQPKPSTATHFLVLGKHFHQWTVEKGLSQVLNYIPFSNGDTEPRIFKVYKDATSISLYGMRMPQDGIIVDSRINSLEKADQKMGSLLAERKNPIIRATLTLLDDNYQDDGKGIDLETVFVGDTVDIQGLDELNSAAIGGNLTIVSIRKSLDTAVIELEGVPVNSSSAVVQTREKVAGIQGKGRIERVLTGTSQGYDLTLQNGWVNYGTDGQGAWANAQFWKDSEGRVYIWGLIKAGTAGSGVTIATMPPAFRPSGPEVFLNTMNGFPVKISANTNGQININELISGGGYANTYLSLNISYYTKENLDHSMLGFMSGWSAYVDHQPSDDWPRPSYYKSRSTGIVWLRGLARGGTLHASIAKLDRDLLPVGNRLFATDSYNSYTRVDINADETDSAFQQIRELNSPNNTWVSLSGIHWLGKTGNKYQYPTLLNGWAPYGYGPTTPYPWGRPGYYVDEFGFCHLEGLAASGTVGTVIFNLPVGARPKKHHIFTIMRDNSVFGEIEVHSDGNVVMTGTNTVWTALNQIMFPTF